MIHTAFVSLYSYPITAKVS